MKLDAQWKQYRTDRAAANALRDRASEKVLESKVIANECQALREQGDAFIKASECPFNEGALVKNKLLLSRGRKLLHDVDIIKYEAAFKFAEYFVMCRKSDILYDEAQIRWYEAVKEAYGENATVEQTQDGMKVCDDQYTYED